MESSSLDTYWRLSNHDSTSVKELRKRLRSVGCTPNSRITKEALVEFTHLVERGLLCYDPCTKSELLSFAKARKVEIETNEGRKSLIQKLKDADENATFEKILDLPAELRNHIYEAYLAEFAEQLDCPSQPPLARTSRQMRAEVLPLFYGTKTFRFHVTKRFKRNNDTDGILKLTLEFPIRTYAFINSLEEKHISRIACFEMAGFTANGKHPWKIIKFQRCDDAVWNMVKTTNRDSTCKQFWPETQTLTPSCGVHVCKFDRHILFSLRAKWERLWNERLAERA